MGFIRCYLNMLSASLTFQSIKRMDVERPLSLQTQAIPYHNIPKAHRAFAGYCIIGKWIEATKLYCEFIGFKKSTAVVIMNFRLFKMKWSKSAADESQIICRRVICTPTEQIFDAFLVSNETQ